ncbi:MAG: pyruvate ferredoxin oxidoreductase [Planctomycetes bacterium]|nr:pyruvate ferredoxin oxidoreductase [Planctomycetota bacterium]
MKTIEPGTEAPPTILTGNQAAAWGAFLSRVQVVSAYPITPQTTVIETLADLTARADWPNRFVNVESEHSAMAVCIGASYGGVRTFTATSSQGLALMHELLHWAAGGRLPVVLVDVNRAMAPGWSIWTDQQDSLSQRDTGWAQFYCSSVQDILDHVILAFRMAEEASVPVMVVEDAFVLSHTAEAVSLPAPAEVDRFLPPRRPAFSLDVEKPRAFGGLLGPDWYQEVRKDLHESLLRLGDAAPRIYGEWERLTGRSYAPVEAWGVEDADVVLLTSGAVSSTAREVVATLRARRKRVGLVQVRMFRPFPGERLREVLRGVPKVAVLDRNCSFGHHGIFHQELKSALYSMEAAERPRIYGYVLGLGGRDVGPRALQEVVRLTEVREAPEPETTWIGAVLPEGPEQEHEEGVR